MIFPIRFCLLMKIFRISPRKKKMATPIQKEVTIYEKNMHQAKQKRRLPKI